MCMGNSGDKAMSDCYAFYNVSNRNRTIVSSVLHCFHYSYRKELESTASGLSLRFLEVVSSLQRETNGYGEEYQNVSVY